MVSLLYVNYKRSTVLVNGNKIELKWLTNPYYKNGWTTDSSRSFPVLFINDKLCELQAIDGIRPKYFYKNKFIIKVDDELHSTKNTIKAYNKIDKEDKKFFPEILAYDCKAGFMVQQFINIQYKNILSVHRDLIKLLKQKYDLEDINPNAKTVDWANWAINTKTNNVIIFDFAA